MKSIRYLGGVALVFAVGCQGMPTVTRTGDVKDIMIGDSLTSGYIAVGPGDEVRWINKRTAPVRVVFLDPEWDNQLSCKNNFGGWMTRSDTAQLATNETASVCFRDAGTFRYTVRMESDRATGDPMFRESSRLAGKAARPWVKPVTRTLTEPVINPETLPVINTVVIPLINPVAIPLLNPMIEQAAHQVPHRPPPPRRRPCLLRSDSDMVNIGK